MDKNKPTNEFTSFIIDKLRSNKGFISASNLCMEMKDKVPLKFQPPKGQFNNWIDKLYNIEKDVSNKDMPHYRWKVEQSHTHRIISQIKKDYVLYERINSQFLTRYNNIATWENLNKIYNSFITNYKIIETKYPHLLETISRFKISNMHPKPIIVDAKPKPFFTSYQQAVLPSQAISKPVTELPFLLNVEVPNQYSSVLQNTSSLLFPPVQQTPSLLNPTYLSLSNNIKNLSKDDMELISKFKQIFKDMNSPTLYNLFTEIEKIKYFQLYH